LAEIPEDGIPHLRKVGRSTHLIVDGKPYIILGGELHNSSSSSLEYMEPIWKRLVSLGLNTVLTPVSWELIEPEEGLFDFSLVDGLIDGSRRNRIKLVFLWFGTWKNAESTYVPTWVKSDLERFKRAQNPLGKNLSAISCFSEEARLADARAFGALMRHIREVDSGTHTVIMVQVENEVGILGTSRDRSYLAETRFAQEVPAGLTEYLKAHADDLHPYLREAWRKAGCRVRGPWKEVFGPAADEVFMAWHFAKYVDGVAAAGKAEYPIPMYVNAWLGPQHEGQQPGEYPSGGPVARMIDVWLAAAPHIDLIAPDIYLDSFSAVCVEYARPNNALFVPETVRDERSAAYVFYVLGQHGAIGFSPFGIDDVVDSHPLTASYRILAGMTQLIAEYSGKGRMIGFVDDPSYTPAFSISTGVMRGFECELGSYRLRIKFNKSFERGKVPAAGLIIALTDDSFIVAGLGFTLSFAPRPNGKANVEILKLDEGFFENGKWVQGRRLNGDESQNNRVVYLGDSPSVRKVKVYEYD
jgi:hypothetical protein